ncbi:UBC-like protein [Calocera cornea HHB12733]|uniref:UBC-like protein n=1 Tax=Calocera cornea HHB12733 TaxID=1353952 RepID=A0A165HUA0_9BASI|nr:UBC-like protein [Calocera cornea HHB12733]
MASRSSHNKNNSAVKRILQEAKELGNDPSTDYCAAPLEDDIFEWHCTIRGPADTEFEGGLYHCRVLLPSEYPFKPPSIMILTPNGRFELNKKICISFTAYHEDLWQPAWGIRTAIVGLQGFFPIKGEASMGVGALDYPAAERKRLAGLSREWVCPECGVPNLELLPDVHDGQLRLENGPSATSTEHAGHVHAAVASPGTTGPPESSTSTSAWRVEDAPASVAAVVTPATPLPPTTAPASVVPAPPTVALTLQPGPAAPAPIALPPTPAPVAPSTSLATPMVERPSPPRTQSYAHHEPLPSRPIFLDGLIVALVAVLAYILAKKVGVQQAVMAML